MSLYISMPCCTSKLEIVPKITIFDEKYSINPYPGNGDELGRIIRLYMAWGSKFIVIVDSDKAGQNAKNRYEKKIGAEITNLIFQLSDVDEKWSGFKTESLFSSAECIRVIKTAYPDDDLYDKTKFFYAIEQMLVNKVKFDFNKGTIQNFQKLIKFIIEKINEV